MLYEVITNIPGKKGALVADVTKGGPAEKAGIRSGDVIVSFDGKNVESEHDLPQIVASTTPGKKVEVIVIRDGKEVKIPVSITQIRITSYNVCYTKLLREENYHRIERSYGTFHRSFTLPSSVDGEKVSARMKDGVLQVDLPKKEQAKPKQIKISA